MPSSQLGRLRPTAAPVALVALLFVLAGGYVHLDEWLDTYRQVPASAPGSAVVRIGFPLNAAVSLLLAGALVVGLRRRRHVELVIAAAIVFQAASLATLIATRTGSVLGWSEPVWTSGADQSRALEIAAIGALLALLVVVRVRGERRVGEALPAA